MSILRGRYNKQYDKMHQLFAKRDDPKVRERLILANINLVRSIAGRFTGYGEPIEDLVQVGIIGLIGAIKRYDPERGIRFSTYATPSISGAIKKHLYNNVHGMHIPEGLLSLCFAAKRAEESLSQRLGRKPTVLEIAEVLGTSEKMTTKALWASEVRNTVSLDTGLSERDGEPRSSSELVGADDPDIVNITQNESITQNEDLAKAISKLKPRSKQIIELLFLDGFTQTYVATLLGCSRQNIQLCQERALRDLHRILNGEEKPKKITTKVTKEPKVKKERKVKKAREVCDLPLIGEQGIRVLGVIWPKMTYDKPTKPDYRSVSAISGIPSDQVQKYIRTLVHSGILIRGKSGHYKKGASDVQIRLFGGITEVKIRPGLTIAREQKINLDDIFPSSISAGEQKLNT